MAEMRLVNATDLAKEYQFTEDHTSKLTPWTIADILNILDEAPTVDAAPVVHGQWEKHPNMYGFVRCSECRDCVVWDEWVNNEKWKYCPNCGAKMDGA